MMLVKDTPNICLTTAFASTINKFIARSIYKKFVTRSIYKKYFSYTSRRRRRNTKSPFTTGGSGAGAGNVLGGGANFDASGSPASGVDGKQFFRNARARISYESFNAFLANIKRLNSHQQTRDETLEEARRIFGNEHQDLYTEFVQLLNRNA
jgi:hypothetical protein